MPERNKNRKKELEDFFRYSQDQMSEEERNTFERSLEQDPFDAEALEGLSSITPEEARAELAGLKVQLQKRIKQPSQTNRNTRAMWYRVAAAVAVLVVVTSVLFTLFNDRIGQLDRKVAESPGLEKEASAPAPSAGKTQEDISEKDEGAETPQKKESEVIETMKAEPEPEVEAETDINIAEKAVTEEKSADEVAAPAPAMAEERADEGAAPAPAMAVERQAAAKSMKRERVEQWQVSGAVAPGKRSISGVVISGEDEQPLPGVIVAVKGSATGTVTDLEGKFQISIEDDSRPTLITRFIGMESKEVPVGDEDNILITLQPDPISLDEAVIIASAPQTITQPTGNTVALAPSDTERGSPDNRSATPVGGKKEFNEYIKSTMRFPEWDSDLTRAVVVLNFVVGYDGRPAEFGVLKSPGKAFSDEAIRLLSVGPDWQPAEMDGVKIEQAMRIRIVFTKELHHQ